MRERCAAHAGKVRASTSKTLMVALAWASRRMDVWSSAEGVLVEMEEGEKASAVTWEGEVGRDVWCCRSEKMS